MVKTEQRCEFVLTNKNKKDQSGADCDRAALSAKGKMLCSFVKFSQRILLENVLRSAWRNCIWISGLNFRVREENSGDKTTFLVLVFVGICECCFFSDELVKRARDSKRGARERERSHPLR